MKETLSFKSLIQEAKGFKLGYATDSQDLGT